MVMDVSFSPFESGLKWTNLEHLSQLTRYSRSVLPPASEGGNHDNQIEFWSTKVVERFRGDDGGLVQPEVFSSASERQNPGSQSQMALPVAPAWELGGQRAQSC